MSQKPESTQSEPVLPPHNRAPSPGLSPHPPLTHAQSAPIMPKKDELQTCDRLPIALADGGHEMDHEWLEAQRGVITDVIKQIGMNIKNVLSEPKNLTNITLPVDLNEPRSYLERLADGWSYAQHFLGPAAATNDPLERFKLVMAFAISGLHFTCKCRKPFNPLLGETYQATFPDGTEIYAEQTSHHPPISNWQMFGPNNSWKFYGYGEWVIGFRGNSCKGVQLGQNWVEFPDGQIIRYNLPELWMEGLLFGDRSIQYSGTMTFKDEKNRLFTELKMPIDSGFFSRRKVPSDHFIGEIVQEDTVDEKGKKKKKETIMSHYRGSWLGCVVFDGNFYWDFKKSLKPQTTKSVENPLPSDATIREDVVFLKQDDVDYARWWKLWWEDWQRRNRLLREGKTPAKLLNFEEHEYSKKAFADREKNMQKRIEEKEKKGKKKT